MNISFKFQKNSYTCENSAIHCGNTVTLALHSMGQQSHVPQVSASKSSTKLTNNSGEKMQFFFVITTRTLLGKSLKAET